MNITDWISITALSVLLIVLVGWTVKDILDDRKVKKATENLRKYLHDMDEKARDIKDVP